MNPDMTMDEIAEYLKLQGQMFRRGLLTRAQMNDVFDECYKLLRVKSLEIERWIAAREGR